MSSLTASSSSSISKRNYDVFLSFRGEDTRYNFTDHLYNALKRSGIHTFRDNPKLEAGEEIGPELLKAIQQSWCSIIVFSESYVFSRWCLDELSEIVKQRNEKGYKVFPIFYNVDPSDLRKQKGKVEEAFIKHEEIYKVDKDKIQRWRNTLTHVADISGWALNNRYESEFIEDIVKKISAKLCQTYPVDDDKLVGISSRLKELYSRIEIGEDDVRIIGICGMGGIGKTTLARVVYNQMSSHFEGKSFITDVREASAEKGGLVSLQKQLLSQTLFDEAYNIFNVHEGIAIISQRLRHKKVLVVIDDADEIEHLKHLVGELDWFGLGSRIIVTTRNEHLLLSYGVSDVYYYKLTTLNDKDALRLFILKAFNSDMVPKDDFLKLSEDVVEYAGGLPLALEVLGCFLCGRNAAQWRSAIKRLKRDSNKEIIDRLRISFDGLEETEQNIYLDIACFFNGKEKDFVMEVLDGCEFFPEIGIDVLVKKSLLKVDEHNHLWMHDLLQEMGRRIVREKCVAEPGKRCRLWEERDVYHVLTNNTATEVIEGMLIDDQREWKKTLNLSCDAFWKMKKLRLLKVLCTPNCDDLNYLSSELRLLDWTGYPLRSLPSSFEPDNLVALVLCYSRIEQLWKGTKTLHKLRVMNLKGSKNLIKTPDLTMALDLEILILEGCTKMVEVHPSIGVLRRLKFLNLRGCKSLTSLPTRIGMVSLETLILSGCSKLQRFPEIDGKMECLLELYLDGTGIEELPSSIGNLTSLVLLNMENCRSLIRLPSSIEACKCLKTLKLSGCSKVENLPENLQQLEVLEELDLRGTAIIKATSFIFQFKILKDMSFQGIQFAGILEELAFWGFMKSSSANFQLNGRKEIQSILFLLNEIQRQLKPSDACCPSLKELDQCGRLKNLPSRFQVLKPSSQSLAWNTMHQARIMGINNYGWAENNSALIMLKKHLKVYADSRKKFDVIIPGSEIPEWFSYQRAGSSIKIPLPPNIRDDSQCMGIAFCCIFVNDDFSRDENLMCEAVIHDSYSGCNGSIFQDKNPRQVDWCGWNAGKHFNQPIMKNHFVLRYLSRDVLYPFSSENKCGEGETKNLSTTDWSVKEYDELELSFTGHCNCSVKVKRCGVKIVYDKDLEELDQIKQHSTANFEHIRQHSADDGNYLQFYNEPTRKEGLNAVEENEIYMCVTGDPLIRRSTEEQLMKDFEVLSEPSMETSVWRSPKRPRSVRPRLYLDMDSIYEGIQLQQKAGATTLTVNCCNDLICYNDLN